MAVGFDTKIKRYALLLRQFHELAYTSLPQNSTEIVFKWAILILWTSRVIVY